MKLRKSTWYGEIRDGSLKLDQRALFAVYVKNIPDQPRRVEVVLQEITVDKSNEQLGYYFGCLVPAVQELTGYDKIETDGVLSRMYLTRHKGCPNEYVASKADLSKEEMSEFIDAVQLLLAEQGVAVEPRPRTSAP